MKKVILYAIATLVVIAAVVAVYRFCFRKSIPDAPAQEQVAAILRQNDCFVCHSAKPVLPFYSSFPVIGGMMGEHVRHAYLFTDLEKNTLDLDNIDEVTLSMLEYSVMSDNMPISQYKMIHWGTGFSAKEKSILAAWIRDTRIARFANGLASDEFAAECIQPIPASIPTDPAKVALGRRLYFDTRLSENGSVSCASCHQMDKGGADHRGTRTSEGIYGQFGGVNAPTVYNAFFNVQQFWNGRAADLQEQAAGPPANPVEMGSHSWDDIVAKLRQDKALVKEFDALYPGEGLTQATVTGAIAEFEKTLLTPDCRFDLYLKGDTGALSDDELKGYQAFKDNACATCHTGVIMGGKSFEQLSIYGDYFADRADIEYCADDDGLKGFTGNDSDLHKFKVPTLRNVALTAPYFHDGSIATLEDAVKAMARYNRGVELSDADVCTMVAFMKSLTGRNPELKDGDQ